MQHTLFFLYMCKGWTITCGVGVLYILPQYPKSQQTKKSRKLGTVRSRCLNIRTSSSKVQDFEVLDYWLLDFEILDYYGTTNLYIYKRKIQVSLHVKKFNFL